MGLRHTGARQPVTRTLGQLNGKHTLHSTEWRYRAALNERDDPATSHHRTIEVDIRAESLGYTTLATVRR